MGFLTTHVLDTASGCPAANVRIEVYKVLNNAIEYLLDVTTNEDGRSASPLLKGDEFSIGTYELHFFIGDYFKDKVVNLDEPSFLDMIPIRFSISLPEEHYHVPLLVSPFSYSTYRGS